MKKIKYVICLALILVIQLLNAQNNPVLEISDVPVPVLHWTFDSNAPDYNSSLADFKARDANNQIVTNEDVYGRVFGSCSFVKDRFNANSKAIKINSGGSIDFSNPSNYYYNKSKFFGVSEVNSSLNSYIDSFTISVWVNFKEILDTERLLFGAKEYGTDPEAKFGISLIGKSLYLKQYYEPIGTHNVGQAWKYKLIAPAEFDAGFGWYHVTVVFARTQKYMRVLLGKPNGGAEYGPGTSNLIPGNNKVKREFDGRLIWIPGIRAKLQDFSYWYMGDTSGLEFDDLMIFDKDLTLQEIKALYNSQKPTSYSVARNSQAVIKGNANLSENQNMFVSNEIEDFSLYPNPSDGITTILFDSKDSSVIDIKITDIMGRTFHTNKLNVIKGNNYYDFDVNQLNLASGIYIVNLGNSSGVIASKRLIVQ